MDYHSIVNSFIYNWKKIISITLISMVFLWIILNFAYPLGYVAPVTILPPETNQGSFSSIFAGKDISDLMMGSSSNANSQLFMEILKSRSARLYVVKKNKLVKYYGVNSEFEAAEKLGKDLKLELNKEGIITLASEVNTGWFPSFKGNLSYFKKLAADISNSYVESLDKLNREKSTSKASRTRKYVEEQLLKTKSILDSTEVELATFQRENKTVNLTEQVKAAITSAAEIKTELIQTEVELSLAENNLQDDNKSLQMLRDKIKKLQSEYNKVEMGDKDFLLAFSDVPELGKKLASLTREVQIQNQVYLLLQQQYQKEKIQESKDLPTVEVLDEAVAPHKPSSPRTVLSSLFGGVFVFLLTSLYFLLQEKKSFVKKF